MDILADQRVLHTTTGEFPLHESHLKMGGRDWTVLHTGVILTFDDEQWFLSELRQHLPYGVALWPSSIALAHDVAARDEALRGTRVLELGAGTGLPGIVAASLGARVVQTDRHEMPMDVCRRNGALNGSPPIEYRIADWAEWSDDAGYDLILGSDVLYGDTMHPHLRRIFETNLAPGGRVLLSDPFRPHSLRLLEAMEGDGWRVSLAKWNLGDERPVGVFELQPPA